MQRDSINISGVLARIVLAVALVYGTWNPEGHSYYHWALAPLFGGAPTAGALPLKFLTGVLLIAAWGVFLNATRRSLGVGGAVLAIAVTGGVIWWLVDLDVVHVSSQRGIAHAVLFVLALLLGIGMSWSFFSRRFTGQIDTDVTQ